MSNLFDEKSQEANSVTHEVLSLLSTDAQKLVTYADFKAIQNFIYKYLCTKVDPFPDKWEATLLALLAAKTSINMEIDRLKDMTSDKGEEEKRENELVRMGMEDAVILINNLIKQEGDSK